MAIKIEKTSSCQRIDRSEFGLSKTESTCNVNVLVHVKSATYSLGEITSEVIVTGSHNGNESHKFTGDLTINPVKQAYEYLMTLDKYKDGVKVSDEPL